MKLEVTEKLADSEFIKAGPKHAINFVNILLAIKLDVIGIEEINKLAESHHPIFVCSIDFSNYAFVFKVPLDSQHHLYYVIIFMYNNL